MVLDVADEFAKWLEDRRNRRSVPHRLESLGYTAVRNPTADDGMWRIDGRRQVIYAKVDLPVPERLRAAQELANAKGWLHQLPVSERSSQ